MLKQIGHNFTDDKPCYIFSVQTKKPAVKGKIPAPVQDFIDLFIGLLTEKELIEPTNKDTKTILNAIHIGQTIYLVFDQGECTFSNMASDQISGILKEWKQGSMDAQISVSTAMTVKSIVDTVVVCNHRSIDLQTMIKIQT